MWTIYEHKRVAKSLAAVPVEVLKRYEKWKDIVIISGPQGLRNIKGLHDESLSGNWAGYRSSRLNIQYRVIYKVEKDKRAPPEIRIFACELGGSARRTAVYTPVNEASSTEPTTLPSKKTISGGAQNICSGRKRYTHDYRRK